MIFFRGQENQLKADYSASDSLINFAERGTYHTTQETMLLQMFWSTSWGRAKQAEIKVIPGTSTRWDKNTFQGLLRGQ